LILAPLPFAAAHGRSLRGNTTTTTTAGTPILGGIFENYANNLGCMQYKTQSTCTGQMDMRLLDSRYYQKPCAWCCDDDRCGGNHRCEPVNFFTHGNYGTQWCTPAYHGPSPTPAPGPTPDYTGWSPVPENLYHHPDCWNTPSGNPHNQQATCGTDIVWQMHENGKSEQQAYCVVKNFPPCKACLEPLCGGSPPPAPTPAPWTPSVPMDGRWHCHDSTNSWSGMGSSGLEDSDQDSWKGLSMSECQDHCKRDSGDQCGCVVYYRCPSSGCEHGHVDGQCWRRGYCDLSKSKRSDPGFTMCNINLG